MDLQDFLELIYKTPVWDYATKDEVKGYADYLEDKDDSSVEIKESAWTDKDEEKGWTADLREGRRVFTITPLKDDMPQLLRQEVVVVGW